MSPRNRRAILLVAGAATAVALFYSFENWRGRRAWERYQATLVARGEWTDAKQFLPPAVPDADNFAKTPLLVRIGTQGTADAGMMARLKAGLGDAKGTAIGSVREGRMTDLAGCLDESLKPTTGTSPTTDASLGAAVLQSLRPLDPELDELRQASDRRYAQFDVVMRFDGSIPNFVALRELAQTFTVSACARAATGDGAGAWRDARVVERLADSLAGHPTLVAAMIQTAIAGRLAPQPLWEGLQRRVWTAEQLVALQRYFEAQDLLAGVDAALRGGELPMVTDLVLTHSASELERKVFGVEDSNPFQGWLLALSPRGWAYQNLCVYHRLMREQLCSAQDVRNHRIDPAKTAAGARAIDEIQNRRGPFVLLAQVATPNVARAMERVAEAQTLVDQAAVACALERFRLAEGHYPVLLTALEPRYVTRLPRDVTTGAPLTYHTLGDGGYELASAAWPAPDASEHPNEPKQARQWIWRVTSL